MSKETNKKGGNVIKKTDDKVGRRQQRERKLRERKEQWT
jgi:hypothetical protein